MSGSWDGSWSFAEDVPAGDAPGDAPPAPRALPRPGECFAERFEVLELLGQGGMAVVLRARDREGGREVALKLLRGGLVERRERLLREGQLTARLRHPGIVGIHAAGEAEGLAYLVYELVPGGRTLADAFPTLPRARRLELLGQVAAALAAAHAEGLVHRDLKPANVLIDERGRARVADFGLALAGGLERLTQTGALLGTPSHMAPEQLSGQRERVGPPTDVWALGVILYELLTGQLPFRGTTLLEQQAQVCRAEPPPPRSLDPSIPRALQAVCLQCLAKRPADRYPHAGAFALDLSNALAARPVSASGGWPRLRRRGPWLGAAGLGVLGLLLLVLLWPTPPSSDEPRLTILLAGLRQGRDERAAVEALLDRPETRLRADLRGEAHLALAQAQPADPAGRAGALRHAEAACAALPRSGPAQRARGDALWALGRPGQAARAFAQAVALGEDGALLDQARASLAAGDYAAADAAAKRAGPERPEAVGLRMRALLGAGDPAAARRAVERLTQATPGFAAQVLAAELAAAEGAWESLLHLRRTYPRRAEPRLAGCRALALHRHELRAAELAWEDARAAGDAGPALDALGAWIAATTARPPRVGELRAAPAPHRAASVVWLLARARRELAFVRRAGASAAERAPNALSLGERRRRAREALDAAAALIAPGDLAAARLAALRAELLPPGALERAQLLREALRGLPDDPQLRLRLARELLVAGAPAEALDLLAPTRPASPAQARRRDWLRGRVLLALDRPAAALAALERGRGRLRLDPARCAIVAEAAARAGRVRRADKLRARLALLEGARRVEAERLFRVAREKKALLSAREALDAYDEVLELAPLHLEARYRRASLLLGDGVHLAEGALECAWVIAKAPHRISGLGEDFQRLMMSGTYLWGDRLAGAARAGLPPADPEYDALANALLLGQMVELAFDEGLLRRALAAANAVLAEDPGETCLWVLRTFLHLRARRWAQAERDLEVAAEELPDSAQLAFYRLLLVAGRGDPASEVRAALERAARLGYSTWESTRWSVSNYPELEPYAGRAGFERLRRGGR